MNKNYKPEDWNLALHETMTLSKQSFDNPDVASTIVLEWAYDILNRLAKGSSFDDAFGGNPTDALLKMMANQVIMASAIKGLLHKLREHEGGHATPPRVPPFQV